jgi:hypothetical protein
VLTLPDRKQEPEPPFINSKEVQEDVVQPSPKITRCNHTYADVVPDSTSYVSTEFSVLGYVKSLEAKNAYTNSYYSDSYYAHSKGKKLYLINF